MGGFTENEQVIARKVTESLTTSEGLRHQLTLDEIASATSEKNDDVAIVLKRLIDKRLVHRLIVEENKQAVFELIHDFLGKQIANQLSDEEKNRKEAEELLTEALRRWKKHGVLLAERELSVLERYKQKLKFTREGMALIYSSILQNSQWGNYQTWFDFFGDGGIDVFIEVYLGLERAFIYEFSQIAGKWNNQTIDHFINAVLTGFSVDGQDKKIDRRLNLLSMTKDTRVIGDNRVLNVSRYILLSKLNQNTIEKALELLMTDPKGVEILKLVGDKAIELMINSIHEYGFLGGWYWFYVDAEKKDIFLGIARQNRGFAISLLEKRIWEYGSAREKDNLVNALSLLSSDVQLFRKILLEHWTAYARQAAAKALTEIGSKDAIDALIEGLSNPYSIVLKQILIALGRKGDLRALPALEKISEDPLISETNLGYVHKTISRIKKREKIE